MKSVLYLKERVDNKDRKSSASKYYFPCKIVDGRGNETYALFTAYQLKVGIDRAKNNTEDLPTKKWWEFWK